MQFRRAGLRRACLLLVAATMGNAASGEVVINEIFHDPPNRTRPEEFIELHNPSSQPVDLTDWSLDDGVIFRFPANTILPPGGFIVVAQDVATFKSRFGMRPLGPWIGSLRNEGERVRLVDAEGDTVDEVTYATGFPWPTAARGAGSSLELLHPQLDNSRAGAWRSSGVSQPSPSEFGLFGPPTPGATNSVFTDQRSPLLHDVRHTPAQPRPAETVAVHAQVEAPNSTPVAVSLEYQVVEPGAYIRLTDSVYRTQWTRLPMQDDGSGGDAIAGDGIFTVVLPESLQAHRRLVRYRVIVESAGAILQAPYPDDECPNFAWFVYGGVPAWEGANQPGAAGQDGVVRTFSSDLFTTLPAYHLLAVEEDVMRSQYQSLYDGVRMWGTLIHEGQVYDHIQFHNRGEASTYVSGKNKWRFHFNRGREFMVRDAWGRPYSKAWDILNLNPCSSPWAAVHRGMSGLDEAISYRVYQLLGVPASHTHFVQFRVIDRAEEAPADDQYNGDAWGLYLAVEQPDGAFLDEHGLPDGNVYKLEGVLDRKHQGATQVTDNSDLVNFAAQSERPQSEPWWRTHFDLPTYYSFHAGNRVVGNVDLRENWNHFLYHHPSGRWMTIPWDLDMQFIPMTHWSGTITQNRCVEIPALRREFRNRAREVIDLLLSDARVNGGQIGQLVDEYARMVSPPGHALTWVEFDQFLWNWHPRTRGDGRPEGETSHRGNFFRTPYRDVRIGGEWVRHLVSADFNGSLTYLREYTTGTFTGDNWSPTIGDPKGYAREYLSREAADTEIPGRPTVTYIGQPGYPLHDLRFTASDLTDPQGADTIAGIAWRIAEIAAPGLPGYRDGEPFRYEITDTWTSGDRSPASLAVRIPAGELRPGRTYRVRARVRDNTGRYSHWSEPVEFVSGPPDTAVSHEGLRISELMYHPPPPSREELAAGFDSEDFEFIELHNHGSRTLELADLRFVAGVNCRFDEDAVVAPGAYAVLVKDPAAFAMRYGTNIAVVGVFGEANLANEGERVVLSVGFESILHEFTYDDRAPWPDSADGDGPSMERIRLFDPDHGNPDNWRASTIVLGTPGRPRQIAYQDWSSTHPSLVDPDADPDSDGRPNWVEFAVGSDALVPDPPLALSLMGRTNGDDPVRVEFQRLPVAQGAKVTLEGSSDLGTWQEIGQQVRSRSGPGESERATYEVPFDKASGPLFLRLRVSREEP